MFDITVEDVFAVYEILKNRYPLTLTTTGELDDGFTVDCPIIVGQAYGKIIQLYEYDGLFVMDFMNEQKTMGTHTHPLNVEEAVDLMTEFMEGKGDYRMDPFVGV